MNLNSKKILRGIGILTAAIILAACGNAATPEPTPDMDAYATAAVQTVEARYTETAIAMPTDTPMPTYTPVGLPTETPEMIAALPTSAPAGSVSVGSSDSAVNPAAPADTSTLQILASAPTAAPTAVPQQQAGDKASWESQSPTDGTHIDAGAEFDITYNMLNTGTTTWTTDYCLRYFTGTNMTKPGKNRYYLLENTAPNSVGVFMVDAVAPTKAGTYTMSMVVSNENDDNFSIVDITIIVD